MRSMLSNRGSLKVGRWCRWSMVLACCAALGMSIVRSDRRVCALIIAIG